jgi:hypothetical protein
MSNANNIDLVNLSQNSNTSLDTFFNNYFVIPSTITSNQNNALIAFFEKQTNGNKQSAELIASSIAYTAMAQGIDPMSILQQFQSLKPGELNLYLAMFLNLNRVATSIVGINNQPTQNKYVTRTILP